MSGGRIPAGNGFYLSSRLASLRLSTRPDRHVARELRICTVPAGAPVTLRPERVVREEGDVTIVEVREHPADGSSRLAGFYVYGGHGDSSVLHESLESAEAEFLRRTST